MPPTDQPPAGLRLPVGQVTVLLGSPVARRHVTTCLDDASVRCASGHGVERGVHRLTPEGKGSATDRLQTVARVARQRPVLVVADRLTDGLGTAERRVVLAELRSLAASGVAVLVDDIDPVAALAVADLALRAGADGSVVAEDLTSLGTYRAS